MQVESGAFAIKKRAAQFPEPLPTPTMIRAERTPRPYDRNIPVASPTNTDGRLRVAYGYRLVVGEAFFRVEPNSCKSPPSKNCVGLDKRGVVSIRRIGDANRDEEARHKCRGNCLKPI